MSFDDYDGPPTISMERAVDKCKPDYEAQAAYIKKKIDVSTELREVLQKYKKLIGLHSFRSISSLAEFIGAIVIKKEDYEDYYQELLNQIEKEA